MHKIKKTLSVILSLMMLLGMFGMLGAVSFAASDTSTLIGRYFSTDNVWYNAARRANGVSWVEGNYPSYDASSGRTLIDQNYFRFDSDIFSGVSQDTGLTFAFEYTPEFGSGERFRHILSIGKYAYGNGTNNHLFISGAHTQHSNNIFQVTWVNSNGAELINAYAADVPQVEDQKYNVVVTIDKDAGIVFYVDGVKKTTVYVNSDLNGQIGNIRSFLSEVNTYEYNYFGCSRWTADAKIKGYLKDFRIYKSVAAQSEIPVLAAGVAGTGNPASGLVGQYYTTDDPWYNAATDKDSVSVRLGNAPIRHAAGFSYMNDSIYQIETDLFKNVTRDTGVTFSFNYRPNFGDRHRHLISIGQREYGDGQSNHFFISGAYAHNSDGKFPLVEWVNGSGVETIAAYPTDVDQEKGREYNIVVTVDKDEGVIFYVDGERKDTVYADSSLNDQLGNIQSFLDEVNTYKYNYIGCSRWTGDYKINGCVSDLRVYQTSMNEEAAYDLIFDMIGTSFDLSQPSFNATAYHYNDPAEGAYSNVVWAPAQGSTPAINEFVKIDRSYFKFFVPENIVLAYDGVNDHTPKLPVTLETYAESWTSTNGHNIYFYFIGTRENSMPFANDWVGVIEGNDNQQWTWWPNINNNISNNMSFPGAYTDNLDDDNQYNTNTHRFWWNAIKYTGSGDTNNYYEKFSNLSTRVDIKTNSTDYRDRTVSFANSNFYVLNYKPVYDILNAASSLYTNQMANKSWMYTESSYAQALLAMRRLTLCNPNLYNYGSNVDLATQICADAIKYAKLDYDVIDLVKKTATVHIVPGAGTSITVTNNGTPVADGATVAYGDTLAVTASALDAYDQSSPVITISGGTVSGNSTLVNAPDITISTAPLSLNTYTLTFDPNGGTLEGNGNSVTATYTQPLPAAIHVSKDGYDFNGYSYTDGGTVYNYYDSNYANVHGNYDVKGNLTVTAQWNPTSYTVSFNAGAGSIDPSALTNFGGTYTIEDSKTLPTATAPVGYHFDGWTVSGSGSHGWGSEKIAQNASVSGKWGNVTLTATYAPNTDTAYTVEYYEMGLDGQYPSLAIRTESLTGTTGETASANTAAPVGFTFASSNVNNILSAPIAADGTTVLKVYFSRNRYTVNVTAGTGVSLNVLNGAQYYYGESFTLTASAATGYDISTLALSVDGVSVANGSTVTVSGDVTVSAGNLDLLKYTVTVSEGVGTTITGVTSGSYDYGTSITVSASANEGYNSAGLKLKAAGNVVSNPYTFTLTGDITISTDDLNKLRVTVSKTEGAGTSISGDGTYDWGDSVTVSATSLPDYEGTLVLKVNGAAVSNPYTFTITENTAVSTDALTAIVYYTVIFNNYDNTKLYETRVAAGGTAVYPNADPAKPAEGAHSFVFAGWDKSLADINENTVITATYTIVHSYTAPGYDASGHFMQCSECGLVDETTRVSHNLNTVTDREATCTIEGMQHEECACGYATASVSIGTDSTNHKNVVASSAVTPTCCSVGYTAGTVCSDCGDYLSGHTEIPVDTISGHLYPAMWTPANGTHTKTCGRPGCTASVENHVISENCSGGTATCSAYRVCDVCGGEYGELDPTNHVNTSPVSAVTANCVTEGFSEGVYCSDCQQYISGHASQGYDHSETGHSYGAWASNNNGSHSKICSRCEAGVENHTLTEYCSGTAATCSSKSVCSVCGAEFGELDPTNHEDLQTVSAVPATCAEPGVNQYYYCSACGNSYTDAAGTDLATEEDIIAPALGHVWSASWTWDDSVTPPTAQASFVCGREASHNTVVDAVVTEIGSTSAHCGESGSVTYRASYVMDGETFTTAGGNDKVITTASLPHLWTVSGWTWSADHSTATLDLVCSRDGMHTHTIADIAAAEQIVSAADCEHDKVVKYIASAEYEGYAFSTETEEITVANTVLGHVFALDGWTWAADCSSATAKFVCTRDDCETAVLITDSTIDENVIVTADCDHAGKVTYTASVSFALTDGAAPSTFTDTTDEIVVPNSGISHDWGEAVYTWNGLESVTATRVCQAYASHVETETAAVGASVTSEPTYTSDGVRTYRAAFNNPAFAAQQQNETIPSVKAQIEAALAGSGSDIEDVDGLLETAADIINGFSPYDGTYDEDFISDLSDAVNEFNTDKNDPEKVLTLADTLETVNTLVESASSHRYYTVTLVLGGGTYAGDTEIRYYEGDPDIALPATGVNRTGFNFSGWADSANNAVTVIDTSAPEDVTVYAVWTVDNTEAEAAINSAEALISDAEDEYEDSYNALLSITVDQLEAALNADPQDASEIRRLIDRVNELVSSAELNKHKFTVFAGTSGVDSPATCTEAGNALFKCSSCGRTRVLESPALGHDMGAWVTVTAPTPSENGVKRRECSRCDYYEEQAIVYTGEKARQIQFVPISGMYYLVHMEADYIVKSRSAPATYWYNDVDLSFEVVTTSSWNYEDYVVFVNGSELTRNADGTYTLPGGADYAQINVSPLISSGEGETGSGECGYCGKVHPNTIGGRIIAIIHAILYFFKNLLKK